MNKTNHPRLDLTGQVFERLAVVTAAPDHVSGNGLRRSQWACRCTCGNELLTQQANNRRSTRLIKAFGESKSLAAWTRDPRCMVTPATVVNRIAAGASAEAAITTLQTPGISWKGGTR